VHADFAGRALCGILFVHIVLFTECAAGESEDAATVYPILREDEHYPESDSPAEHSQPVYACSLRQVSQYVCSLLSSACVIGGLATSISTWRTFDCFPRCSALLDCSSLHGIAPSELGRGH